MKPLIGIVAHTDLNQLKKPTVSVALAYSDAVVKAGGLPMILPLIEDRRVLTGLADQMHGFLFPGGNDMDPSLYGESPVAQLGRVDKALDRFQMAVLDLAMARARPVLAICRGCQVVNVALGGSLYQDIASQIDTPVLEHMREDADTEHPVAIEPGSRLHALFGPRIPVNSKHHQAIKQPAADLVVTAHAPDGVIEAAQHRNLPIDLVQWHPERMLIENDAMLPLFRSFVDNCGT